MIPTNSCLMNAPASLSSERPDVAEDVGVRLLRRAVTEVHRDTQLIRAFNRAFFRKVSTSSAEGGMKLVDPCTRI